MRSLTWITSSYGWFAIVVPIVVAAPGYFDGELSFGALMMVVGAFNQVQTSLRWFVDNLAQIADWRATLLRIVAFRDALPAVETIGEETGRIEVVDAGSDQLVLEDLGVALPDACATLDQARVEVRPGERIQIVGKAGAGKSTLFRALAGMWPWGAGTIQLPPRETDDVHAAEALSAARHAAYRRDLPRRRRAVSMMRLCVPRSSGSTSATLCPRSTVRTAGTVSWRSTSNSGWPLRRLLLHAPRWVVLDDAISALDDDHRRLLLSIFERELPEATLIRLGREPALDGFWTRTLHIIEHPDGPCLRAGAQPRVLEPAAALV